MKELPAPSITNGSRQQSLPGLLFFVIQISFSALVRCPNCISFNTMTIQDTKIARFFV